ncbi:MAG: hypothetical protein ACOZF0_21580 [Thermodesulfobacteriota bacterium]
MNCANTEGIFRILQSMPSAKAEPSKRWLAKIGCERMQEIDDPEAAIKRTRECCTELELIFSMLGAAATAEIARKLDARGFAEFRAAARKGGRISGEAREKLEAEIGKSTIIPENCTIDPGGGC